MNVEEAKKVAETIKRAQLNELTSVNEIVKILTAEPAAPVEKEYRAGEWVPKHMQKYWFIGLTGIAGWETWGNKEMWGNEDTFLSIGNVYPTEAIAEAAKKHAEFWRAFDMADEGGKVSIWVWTTGGLHVSANDSKDSNPRWQSIDSARAWVDSHGGEAYVSEMLTKGRAFRFKWGGEQAQTIARWRDKVNQPGTFLVPACEALEIVDSQAQKIAEQGKRIGELEKAADVYVRKIESWGI